MSTQVSTAVSTYSARHSVVRRVYEQAARLDRVGMGLLRLGLIIVLCWIGGLKFADYEADGIVPLVANSPLMSFFYHYPAPEYHQYMNKEGEVIPAHQQWHKSNGTYSFSHGLGVVIVLIGVLIAAYPVLPQVSAVGSFLLILMSLTTLSFLVTTPEAWVPALGVPHTDSHNASSTRVLSRTPRTDDSDHWYRSYGNENWEFNDYGLMASRYASINDLPILEADRK